MKRILKKSTMLLLSLLVILAAVTVTAAAAGGGSGKTGFYESSGSWYYYVNGQIDQSRNDVIRGTVNGQDGWWYVVGGKVQLGYTGVADYANSYGWWYIKNGKVDFSHNGVDQNKYGWWYVTGGQVRFDYTGVADYANAYGWWYIRDGKVDFGKTGVEQNRYGWWRVVNGKVDFNCNSVEQNDYGWWYITGGQVRFDYTGVADYANAYGWWYIRDGKVDFGFSGVADNKNGSWYVENGKVDFTATVYDVNRLSKKQNNMIAPLSSFLLMNREIESYNLKSEQDQFWRALEIIVMRYPSTGGSEVWLGGAGYIATERYIKECASAMFSDFDGNLPITDDMKNGKNAAVQYYDGNFDFGAFDDGMGVGTQIISWVEHPDGTCTVEVKGTEAGGAPDDRLKNGILEVDRFELVKNQYTASFSNPIYTYTIASMETVYEWNGERYVYS